MVKMIDLIEEYCEFRRFAKYVYRLMLSLTATTIGISAND